VRINDVVTAKDSRDVVTVHPRATVAELVGLLAEHNIGALVVVDDGAVVGIVSERDVVRHLVDDPDLMARPVAELMVTDVHTCTGHDLIESVMETMTEARVRHLPVLADGRLTGIISIGDVVKSRMSQLEFERDQLDSYVHQT